MTMLPTDVALYSPLSLLTGPLIERMVEDWHAGRQTLAEDLLAYNPDLACREDVSLRLIYEEICLREEYDEPAEPAEFFRRFPRWRDQLKLLLDCHEALGSVPDEPRFPEVGEEMAGFLLAAELGRGALSRVFLATRPGLTDQPVVLKLTPAPGGDRRSLARLQHTHIVPMLSASELPDRGLRALCMPYLGGTTMDRLLDEVATREPRLRTGRDLLGALDRLSIAIPGGEAPGGPAREILGRESYARSVCWIASCLAEALDHAHRRGLVHLDVRPANVLLTAEGMPMLLDFHLARAPLPAGAPPLVGMGGTPGSMPPEQAEALAAIREGRTLPCVVDARADVYAMGVLLYQALAGTMPPEGFATIARSIRLENPTVGAGLAEIIARCLAPDPRARYQDAGSLAEDLGRYLDHRPLRFAPDWSLSDRWSRWRRRSPKALARSGAMTLASMGVVSLAMAAWAASARRLDGAASALDRGRRHLEAGAHREAIAALRGGLDGLESRWTTDRLTPGLAAIRLALIEEHARARRADLGVELRVLADRARSLTASDRPDPGMARTLLATLEGLWEARRDTLTELLAGSPREDRARSLADLLDLGVLRAELHVRLAGEDGQDAAMRGALRILGVVEGVCGPSVVLEFERRQLAVALGLKHEAEAARVRALTLTPRASWEWTALGRSELKVGELDAASESLARASEAEPGVAWPHFYRGQCALRRGRYAEALDAFGASVALGPLEAAFRHGRGLAYAGLGEQDRARDDLEAARRMGINPRPADRPPHAAGPVIRQGPLDRSPRPIED